MALIDQGTDHQTIFGRCRAQLGVLCRGVLGEARADEAVAQLDKLVPALGDRPVSAPPLWSGMCDDASPYELSVAMRSGGSSEVGRRNQAADVRLLLEAHRSPASPQAYWRASQRLTHVLCQVAGVDWAGVRQIEDLFVPRVQQPFFVCQHGLEFRADRRALGKIYLNPAASGRDPWEVVGQAAERLGVVEACRRLRRELPASARVTLISVDLSRGSAPRFKVYVRRWHATPDELTDAYMRGEHAREQDIPAFTRLLTGSEGSLARRPVFMTYHLTKTNALPSRVVLSLPMFPYCAHDGVARDRILRLLDHFAIDPKPYLTVHRAVCGVGVVQGPSTVGSHSYVSFQREATGARVTTYFCPLLYAPRHGLLALDPQKNFWADPTGEAGPIPTPHGVSTHTGE